MRLKKWGTLLLALMLMLSMTTCGSKDGDENGTSGSSSETEVETAVLGADSAGADATELSYWTFVDLHGKHFEKMLGLWNEANPDISDIEVGRFPDFLAGETVPLVELNDAVEPYKENIVESRLGIYSKDGKIYGFPTHVGATVAFYNVEILEAAGVNYEDIVTWDDYKAAGIQVYEKTGKFMGTADTSATWQTAMILTFLPRIPPPLSLHNS